MKKPAYSYYTDRMWRDFIPRWEWNEQNNAPPNRLLPIQSTNYDVCLLFWNDLTQDQRDIIKTVTCTEHEQIGWKVGELAQRLQISPGAVWTIAFRIGRVTALQRGLIDYKKGEDRADGQRI